MQKTSVLFLMVMISSIFSCSKEKLTYSTYPSPTWVITSIEDLPHSFTAILSLPKDIANYASEEDKIAAFIGDECRGVGNLVVSSDGESWVYYVTVRGADDENKEILFRYYNSKLSYLYESHNEVVFQIDGYYGTYDSPQELLLSQI